MGLLNNSGDPVTAERALQQHVDLASTRGHRRPAGCSRAGGRGARRAGSWRRATGGLPHGRCSAAAAISGRAALVSTGAAGPLHRAEPPEAEAEAAVRAGDSDLAVVFSHERDDDPVPGDLLRVPLSRHPVHAVVRDGAVRPERLADLAAEPWIAGCVRCRAHLRRCVRTSGSTPTSGTRPTTTSSCSAWSPRLGVALLPAWALAASTQTGVVTVNLPDVDGRVVEVLLRPDARRVPAIRAAPQGLRAAAVSRFAGLPQKSSRWPRTSRCPTPPPMQARAPRQPRPKLGSISTHGETRPDV